MSQPHNRAHTWAHTSAHTWAVLLAGGVGSRFWPLSRRRRPKQLLDLFGEGPLLRRTFERVAPLVAPERTIVVTSEALAADVAALLPEVPTSQILAEPSGRNTAPAIAWAAQVALQQDPGARLMVLPSDHHIADEAAFVAAARHALQLSDAWLVTLGIVPTHPETGYGYIQRGEAFDASAFRVQAFVEKPDLATAAGYLAGGAHLWNAGMFFMGADLFLAELARHRPSLAQALTPDARAAWDTLEAVSIDVAVMEKSDKILVLPTTCGWSDVGSWRALEALRGADADNFVAATVDLRAVEARDNVFFSDTPRVIGAVGVEGLIVAVTDDAVLVADKTRDQEVKAVVADLQRRPAAKDVL